MILVRIQKWRQGRDDAALRHPLNLLILDALEAIMVSQSDLDARADAISADVAKISTNVATIKNRLDAALAQLAEANPELDLAKLDAGVQSLDEVAAAINAIANPAPEATPAPADAQSPEAPAV